MSQRDAETSEFMQLSPEEQWERVHRRILFEGASEQEHWMHREIERLRKRLEARPGDVHVLPTFGKPHEDSSACWCGPRPDPATLDRAKYANTVWIHEAQQ